GFIRGDDGRAFAFGPNELQNTPFEQLLLGTRVDFEVKEQQPEPSATAIHVDHAREAVPVDSIPPSMRGGADVEAMITQAPPSSGKDETGGARRESLPASEPPRTNPPN